MWGPPELPSLPAVRGPRTPFPHVFGNMSRPAPPVSAAESALSVKQRNAVMVTRLREIRKGEGFHTPVAPAPPPGEPSQHPLKSARSLVKWRKDGSQLPSLQLRQERARAEARMHDENMRIAVMLCDCKPHYQRTRHVQLFSQHRKHLALACRSKVHQLFSLSPPCHLDPGCPFP